MASTVNEPNEDEATEPVEEPTVLSYDPALLPAPVSVNDAILMAVLVELRLLRKLYTQLVREQKAATRAQEKAARASTKK